VKPNHQLISNEQAKVIFGRRTLSALYWFGQATFDGACDNRQDALIATIRAGWRIPASLIIAPDLGSSPCAGGDIAQDVETRDRMPPLVDHPCMRIGQQPDRRPARLPGVARCHRRAAFDGADTAVAARPWAGSKFRLVLAAVKIFGYHRFWQSR
jgi:hypothetical protein